MPCVSDTHLRAEMPFGDWCTISRRYWLCFHTVVSVAALGKEDRHLSVRVQSVYRTTLLTHLTSSHRPSHTHMLVHNMTEKGKMMGVGRGGWGCADEEEEYGRSPIAHPSIRSTYPVK